MVGLVLRRDLDPSTRQMACVLLRQYVEVHWSQLSDKFESFSVDPMVRGKEVLGISFVFLFEWVTHF